MKKIGTTDSHATAVGMFYRIAGDYIEKFKIGGKQKLQKIVGEDLFYKKGKDWWWNNPKIIRMSISELKNLTKKIENAKITNLWSSLIEPTLPNKFRK